MQFLSPHDEEPEVAFAVSPDVDEDRPAVMVARARELTTRYVGLDGMSLLRPLIEREFSGRLAVVSTLV